jgi:hypothetical protein
MADLFTRSLFDSDAEKAGSLACGIEIAATMADSLALAQERGTTRDAVADKMSHLLGERITAHVLNAYTATSKDKHEVSLRRAIAFDAALGEDVMLGLFARKRGGRKIITAEEAAYIELGRIHQAEKELAERKRALQAMLKAKRGNQ